MDEDRALLDLARDLRDRAQRADGEVKSQEAVAKDRSYAHNIETYNRILFQVRQKYPRAGLLAALPGRIEPVQEWHRGPAGFLSEEEIAKHAEVVDLSRRLVIALEGIMGARPQGSEEPPALAPAEPIKDRRFWLNKAMLWLGEHWSEIVIGLIVTIIGGIVVVVVAKRCGGPPPAPAPMPSETPTPPATVLPPGGGILHGDVSNKRNGLPIEGAWILLIEYHAMHAGSRDSERSGPDGTYRFTNLDAAYYEVSAEADGYAGDGPYNVDLVSDVEEEVDFRLVPEEAISPRPFDDGTLEVLFSLDAPLSPIEGHAPLGLIATVKDAKVVALNATGFEREMIDVTMAITNTTEWPVYVDFSRSYLLGRYEEALPEEFYEALYRFDVIGTQFLLDRMPGPLTMIEAGDTIERNIAFADLEELSIQPDLENITPVLCASVAPSSPWQPLDFQGFFHDSVWSPDYLPHLLCR